MADTHFGGTVDVDRLSVGGTDVTDSIGEVAALNGVTASAAELNLNDGAVAGTAVASKTLALGADKNVDVLAVADLKLGAGAGTSVTATAAELNKLDGVGAAVASGTQAALIADPAGGATQDAEARAAIASIIDALQAFGIVAAS